MALDYLCCTIENIFTLIKVESIQENVKKVLCVIL